MAFSSAIKLPKEDEESCNDSEHDESLVAEGMAIVRPKSTKRGPFDFDGTRCFQELNNEHTVSLILSAVSFLRVMLCRFAYKCINIDVVNRRTHSKFKKKHEQKASNVLGFWQIHNQENH